MKRVNMKAGYLFQRLVAQNDRNGNPRRLWVLYEKQTGNTAKVIEEGYAGRPEECDARRPGMVELPEIEITNRFFATLRRDATRVGIYEGR